MTRVLRKSKTAWIVTLREGEAESIVCVTATFRSAYKLALFEARIGKPCLAERQARLLYRKLGRCILWNTDEFESMEAAMYLPHGKLAKIQEVPIKRA